MDKRGYGEGRGGNMLNMRTQHQFPNPQMTPATPHNTNQTGCVNPPPMASIHQINTSFIIKCCVFISTHSTRLRAHSSGHSSYRPLAVGRTQHIAPRGEHNTWRTQHKENTTHESITTVFEVHGAAFPESHPSVSVGNGGPTGNN